MMSSAKGTKEKPGKHVKEKAGLNRSIADQSWSTFLRLLEYKLDWRGGIMIDTECAYSSQECPKCGFTHKLNRESQSRFGCMNPECNFTANADFVGSLNIYNRGMAKLQKAERPEIIEWLTHT